MHVPMFISRGTTTLIITAVLVGLAVISGSAQPVSIDSPRGPVPGRFIIKFRDATKVANGASALSGEGELKPLLPASALANPAVGGFWSYYYVFTGTNAVSKSSLMSALSSADVEWIEQDQYLEFFSYPTDSLFGQQWWLRNTGQPYLGIERIDGLNNDQLAYKSGAAGSDVGLDALYVAPPSDTAGRIVVAILDTGMDLKHPELKDHLWRNRDEIPGNGRDDDHNGYIDDTLGIDISGDIPTIFLPTPDLDPTDIHGHGTHIAGIVGAAADGNGVVGVAPGVELMPIKIRPNSTSLVGSLAIIYAVNNGARVINISWGTPFEALMLQDAVRFARESQVFVAVASGNTGVNEQFYPAAFPEVFTVGAGNSQGNMAYFSTWGPHVDLIAPGEDILSLRALGTDMYAEGGEPRVRIIGPDSLYYLSDGTSMSTPAVAGAAALLLSLRPDLDLGRLENILRMGARDLVDPRNVGDSLPGPDTVCGYGYLNIHQSLQLVTQGGVAISSPELGSRRSGSVNVVLRRVAQYSGSYLLEYASDGDPENWQTLSAGVFSGEDSIAVPLAVAQLSDKIWLRVTDQFGLASNSNFTYVDSRSVMLTAPASGSTQQYTAQISGSVYGPDYDSLRLQVRHQNGSIHLLTRSTREIFDSTIFVWSISGQELGPMTLLLEGYFAGEIVRDSVSFTVLYAYAQGWPQTVPGRASQSAVSGDINNDGVKELIVGTVGGLYVYRPDGTLLPGFPALPNKDMRCIPAIYDCDGDGKDDIVCTNTDGIHIFRYDGSYAAGWPRFCITGEAAFGFPSPSIVQLTPDDPPAIVIMAESGQILAFELNGDSYFYSLHGWYADFHPGASGVNRYGGGLLSGVDVNGDGPMELVVAYSSLSPLCGTGLLDGRTGLPAFNRASNLIFEGTQVYGSAIADLDGDLLPEIVTLGVDNDFERIISVKTQGTRDLPGWPRVLTGLVGWRGNNPVIADLNHDFVPEILVTCFEFDVGILFIFEPDGTPYIAPAIGQMYGEAYRVARTISAPIVALIDDDQYPDVAFRAGYILPGTGPEQVYVLDHQARLKNKWPIATSTIVNMVAGNPYAPFIDDLDNDGKVEMVLTGDAGNVFVWHLDAPSHDGKNTGRLLADNRNSGVYTIPDLTTPVPDNNKSLPTSFGLAQNYPNPFNPTTTISFSLPKRERATLELFDLLGRRVRLLLDRELGAGNHEVTFTADALASGVYLYRLTAGDASATQKMVLVK